MTNISTPTVLMSARLAAHPPAPLPPPCVQEDFEEELVLPLDVMPLNGVGQTFTVLRRPAGAMALGKVVNILKFKVREIDPGSGAWGGGGGGAGVVMALGKVVNILSSKSGKLTRGQVHGWVGGWGGRACVCVCVGGGGVMTLAKEGAYLYRPLILFIFLSSLHSSSCFSFSWIRTVHSSHRIVVIGLQSWIVVIGLQSWMS